jgi:hypothetical protein
LRLAAAVAFAQVRDKSATTILSAAMRDTDFTVREAVQKALAALAET